MKTIFTLTATIIMLFAFSTQTFASNVVSVMATTKGGQHIAECAQSMDKGISKCAKMTVCEK